MLKNVVDNYDIQAMYNRAESRASVFSETQPEPKQPSLDQSFFASFGDSDLARKVLESKTICVKSSWLLLFLCLASIMVAEIAMTIKNYQDSPLRTAFTILTRHSMDYPEIYICPPNQVRSGFWSRNSRKALEAVGLRQEMMVPEHINSEYFWNYYANETSIFTTKNYDYDSLWKTTMEMGVEEDPFFVLCSFRAAAATHIPCRSLFRPVLDYRYGKCYVLNIGSRKQIVPAQGLLLILNTQFSQIRGNLPRNLTPSHRGLLLNVQRKVQGPFHQSIIVPTNAYSKLSLLRHDFEFVNSTSPTSQSCLTSQDRPFRFLDAGTYSRKSCKLECYLAKFQHFCHCLPVIDKSYLKPNLSVTFCSLNQIRQCRRAVYRKFQEHLAQCQADCLQECEIRNFDYRLSYTPLNLAGFPYIPPNSTLQDFVYLQISFPSLSFEDARQSESMDLVDVMGNVGGQIGLWLGLSLFVILQIPIALFSWLFIFILKKMRDKNH